MISFLYYLYERRLLREIRERPVPRHLGLILDGNRRYALERGFVDPLEAYALGARKLDDVLLWCDELSIPAVSLWVLSTENFRRDASEVSGILETVEAKLVQLARHPDERRGAPVGVPPLAERVQRVLLLRRPLAGVQEDRFPPRRARLPAARPPLRPVAE